MAALSPFRALRPAAAAAARVAAVPYDVVSTDEARVLAGGEPLSFLHVSRAEVGLPPGTDPYAAEVYETAAGNLERLTRAAPLLRDETPRLYVYRLQMGPHVQTGVAGCFSLDEYEQGLIRKHEHTRRDKEDDRTRHILTLRAQTGPVFLTYRARPAVDAIVGEAAAAAPLFDFRAPDEIRHTVWALDAGATGSLVEAFRDVPELYIADGHHRAASAARVRRTLGAGGVRGEWDTVLAVAFPHTEMQVLPYNRVVKDLGAFSPASFLGALRERCAVRDNGAASPVRPGEVGMFLDGRWYTIWFGAAPADLPPAEQLDVSRLQEAVIGPLLGIGDVRSDPRIDFVGGARGTAVLESRVESGLAAVAFSMYPVGVGDLMAIADAGGIMPPKSTWFEPKLRDGLLSHEV